MAIDKYEVGNQTLTVKELNRMDRKDCFSCAVVGTGAFIGLGAWTLHSGLQQLHKNEEMIIRSGSKWTVKHRKFGIHALSLTLIGIGVTRFWWFRYKS